MINNFDLLNVLSLFFFLLLLFRYVLLTYNIVIEFNLHLLIEKLINGAEPN